MIRFFCRKWDNCPAEQTDEMEELHAHLVKIQPLVLPDHRDSGIKYLESRMRMKAYRHQFNDAEREILRCSPTIRWVDTYNDYANNHDDTRALYRVHAYVGGRGMFFDYWMRPWQSGEAFEIFRNARYV